MNAFLISFSLNAICVDDFYGNMVIRRWRKVGNPQWGLDTNTDQGDTSRGCQPKVAATIHEMAISTPTKYVF